MTNRRFWTWVSRLFLAATSLLSLLACPHSKVEESFNLQATHDLYYHGIMPALRATVLVGRDDNSHSVPYDHLKYPGVVPRTFAGPLFLSSAVRMLGLLLRPFFTLSDHPMLVQFLCRFLLLACHWHALFRLAQAVQTKFGKTNCVEVYFGLISGCQFHLPYYGSRMLPNVFALVLVTHAHAEWLLGKPERATALLVVATVIFRCDVLLLLGTMGLFWLVSRQIELIQAISVGFFSVIVSLLVTVPIDSILWQRLVWPEGEVFYFNTILGKSSDWGTSPWHWYLTSALPKSMIATLFLVPLSFLRIPEHMLSWWNKKRTTVTLLDPPMLGYLIPIAGFIGLYSFLGHKEMRFIFPALPMLNVAAAVGMGRLHSLTTRARTDKDKGSISSKLLIPWILYMGGILTILSTFVASLVFLAVSRHNYPGGQALELLSTHIAGLQHSGEVRVYIDVASAMSGVSLFGQAAAAISTNDARWVFEKAGYEQEHAEVGDFSRFTHLLSEELDIPGFHSINVAQGYPQFDFRHARIITRDAIHVLERTGWKNM